MKRLFGSFAELGAAMGIRSDKKQKPVTLKCRKCGGSMSQCVGTNVFVCNGTLKNGNPCNHTAVMTVKRTA